MPIEIFCTISELEKSEIKKYAFLFPGSLDSMWTIGIIISF